jgi:hypothetical protein
MRLILVLLLTFLFNSMALSSMAHAELQSKLFNVSRLCGDGSKPADNVIEDATSLALPYNFSTGQLSVVARNESGEVCLKRYSATLRNNLLYFTPTPVISTSTCVHSGTSYSFDLELFKFFKYQTRPTVDGGFSFTVDSGAKGNKCALGQMLTVTFTPIQKPQEF